MDKSEHETDVLAYELSQVSTSDTGERERKIDFYDAIIIHSNHQEDIDMAKIFHSQLINNIIMENGEPPKVYIREHGVTSVSGVDDERLAIRNSTFRFVIVSKNLTNDEWSKMLKDEALMSSFQNEMLKWNVIPVHIDDDSQVPFGMGNLVGINMKNLDGRCLENLTAMFNKRSHIRIDREKDLAEQDRAISEHGQPVLEVSLFSVRYYYCVCVHNNSENNGSVHLKLEHIVVYENS